MATIGQSLPSPENGWIRYENTDSRIKYTGTWVVDTSAGIYTNNNGTYTLSSSAKVNFKFYGTKIRMISNCYVNKPSDIKISIDGKTAETYSEYSSAGYFILTYEKIGLSVGLHTVEVSCPTLLSGKNWNIDAIDIGNDGYLTDILVIKYLIQDGTDLKTITSGNLVVVCNTTDATTTIESAFLINGLSNLSLWNNNLVSQIANSTFKIAIYRNAS